MPVELDIAGNFAKGQAAAIQRRRSKQLERAIDYELAREDDSLVGRRSAVNRERVAGGMDPYAFNSDIRTNGDPWYMKLQDWWKQRRASRVMPSRMMPEQEQTIDGEAAALGFDAAQTYPLEERGAISVMPYKNGGRVSALPSYRDGGTVNPELEEAKQRAAANRARVPATVASSTETVAPRTALPPPSLAQRAGSAALNVGRSALRRAPFIGTAVSALTPTEVGSGELRPEQVQALDREVNGIPQGNQGPEQSAPTPTTDERIAQSAIQQGSQMAQQAAERSKPPGAVDFSQVDFNAGDIPNMPVRDWIKYRAGMVSDLMMQGQTAIEAHKQVTQMQQQGFVDYAQQALMHLQGGNPNAAATALRAAYQYFPNGTDVEVGAQIGRDGQPVLVGRGRDEVSGVAKGQPMVLNSERLAAMIENFSNPNAFLAWTKDWRDEQFNRQKFEEVEKPKAQSEAQYRDRAGQAALVGAAADVANADARMVEAENAGTRARGQGGEDLETAQQHFYDRLALLGVDEDSSAKADELAMVMAILKTRYPERPSAEIINRVMQADRDGALQGVKQKLGIP